PYWLDGFIPLAYLLGNEDMIGRVKRYMDAILSFQKEDGWICPCADEDRPTYDTWAIQLISKVLVVYYQCSGDERIPSALYRVLKNYHDLLVQGTVKLFDWGKFRWFEGLIAIRFLYERYPEPWLPELAKLLKEQGADYTQFTDLWIRPLNRWRFDTHIVNLAMMLKAEAVSQSLFGGEYTDYAETLRTHLDRYNGTPVGLFTGDECLSGLSPVQGTELCAVVEQMYSYELLYAATGDPKWAERLEILAFNALPATISDDMWTHQYVQLSNQIACEKFPGKSFFRTNGPDAHLFGLEPNYGCCTANFNQAWPKFALSTFLWKDNVIENAIPVPSTLTLPGKRIALATNYPFENKFTYTLESDRDFTFRVRIPSFAKKLTVNGNPSETASLEFAIHAGTQTIEITFETDPVMFDRPHDLKSIRCGSLIFSLPISFDTRMLEYETNGVPRKFPYCDYELIPTSAWNYGYTDADLVLERRKVGNVPFSCKNPPVVIHTRGKRIEWGLADGYESVCAKVPESRSPIAEAEEITLYPYGCAKLRMTELPLLK
ncbi:MAG: glycoside hydrolase family 127 protein, partial [Clostridia bacterium]|nr:glycoside hydrolase family 127 protein [Clostridia bacterium]